MTSDPGFLLALEGGGTRSQAVLLNAAGQVTGNATAKEVNTNFVAFEQAQAAVQEAARAALSAAGVSGGQVKHIALGLVGPRFGEETFGSIFPQVTYHYYTERQVVFSQAGIYRPHGVALVAATGATAFGVRSDDGRQITAGGWGSLLGDEGSGYAVGLQALRAAARAYEGRLGLPTRIVAALCEHFELEPSDFRGGLVRLAYQKPLSRSEIAALAPLVSRLAQEDDPLALQILDKAAEDLAGLALFVAHKLFSSVEDFDVVVAGGLLNAGERILAALRAGLGRDYPHASLKLGSEMPATALGKLAYFDLTNPGV